MTKRDRVFDLMVELADFAHEDGLPRVSRKLEEALDVFLTETGSRPADAALKTRAIKPLRQRAAPGLTRAKAARAKAREV